MIFCLFLKHSLMTFITTIQVIVRKWDLYINWKMAFKVVAMSVEQAENFCPFNIIV